MTTIGFHASHEQVHPAALLSAVQQAERVGFDAAMCSDHLAPWNPRQGHSGFAWSWLGAALATTSLPFGVVTAPGQRYHPAVAAQSYATLAAMFPGRFWVALGSGENMNEHVTGDPWPDKPVRDARLLEVVDVVRRLLAGEEVSHRGLVTLDRARVWTLPAEPPALLAAAVSAATAARGAGWADGLVTVNQAPEALRRVVGAYRDAGGRGSVALQVHVSWARDEGAAEQVAHDQWRSNVFPPPLCWDLATPEQFDQASAHVSPADVRGSVLVSSDPRRLADDVAALVGIGFDQVYLHHVGQEQGPFLDMAGEALLPALRERLAA